VAIFALTADGTASERDACVAAGMDGVLVKPFDFGGGLADALAAARARDFMLS
jgi:CheY-like chemotaxis protein